jgi:hypothetical protein
MKNTAFGLLLLGLILASTVSSSKADSQTVPSDPGIKVLVTANGGGTLKHTDVTAEMDGRQLDVQEITPANTQPLSFVILIDVSRSSVDKQSYIKKAAWELFRTLAVPQNTAFFGDFNDELYLNRKPTTADEVVKEMNRIKDFRGGTALYDSLIEATKLVSRVTNGTMNRRAIFVFTVGDDNASRSSIKDAIQYAQRESVPVYGVGLLGHQTSKKAAASFQSLCASTGGVAVMLSEPRDVTSSVADEAANQMWLTLRATGNGDGKLHPLTMHFSEPGIHLSAPSAVLWRNER